MTILTDKPLDVEKLADIDAKIVRVTLHDLPSFNGSAEVAVICGSRAMAIVAATMELPNLKLFQLTSAGFDGVPLDVYADKGVTVANAGGVYSVPIAETVVFGILQMAKRLRKNPNNRRFKLTRGYREITEMMDKKVLIMGAGNIGTAVAQRLDAFAMQVDGYDPYCEEKPPYKTILRDRAALITALSEYDYIVSTMPDNEATRRFIDAELFSCMKNTAVVVNVGRKAVFDNEAFYAALKARRIGGAVLDMFERLPNPITNKFRRLSNVIVLPGVAAISREVNDRLRALMTENVRCVLCGDDIGYIINRRK